MAIIGTEQDTKKNVVPDCRVALAPEFYEFKNILIISYIQDADRMLLQGELFCPILVPNQYP
jgi:hypothetical protein